MTAWPEHRRAPDRSPLARAVGWLIAPAESGPGPAASAPLEFPASGGGAPDPPRPVVAVLGLAPCAGASTIARAVAARLAAFDPLRAALLHTADPPRGGVATGAATQLARAVARTVAHPRPIGRLCLLDGEEPLPPLVGDRLAPLVVDLGHGQPTEAAVALADHAVLVAPPEVEPALVGAVEASLRGPGMSVTTVLNRAAGDPPAEAAHALVVPESRLAAQLTLACREPRGALGAAAGELAERSLAEVWR